MKPAVGNTSETLDDKYEEDWEEEWEKEEEEELSKRGFPLHPRDWYFTNIQK